MKNISRTIEDKLYREVKNYIMTVIDCHSEDSTVIDYCYAPSNRTLTIIGREDIVNDIIRDAYELYNELLAEGEISA